MTHVTICIRGVVIPSGYAYDEDLYILQQHLSCMRSIYNTGVCVGDFGIENVPWIFFFDYTCNLLLDNRQTEQRRAYGNKSAVCISFDI